MKIEDIIKSTTSIFREENDVEFDLYSTCYFRKI